MSLHNIKEKLEQMQHKQKKKKLIEFVFTSIHQWKLYSSLINQEKIFLWKFKN